MEEFLLIRKSGYVFPDAALEEIEYHSDRHNVIIIARNRNH